MSDYIAPGGFYGHQRSALKSVYYPPPQLSQAPPVAGQLQPQGSSSQLPPGAVPVINLPTPGIAPHGFQLQQQPIGLAPQIQYSNPPGLYQAAAPIPVQLPPQQAAVPTFVDSDYAAAGWGSAPYHTAPSRVVNQPPQRQPSYNDQGIAVVENSTAAVLDAARSEYEQAMMQAQRAAERLNLLTSTTQQSQFSIPSISQPAAPQQGFGQQAAAPQQQPSQGYQSGFAAATSQQVRFGNATVEGGGGGSSYRFEESDPAPSRTFNKGQADSVYIGMPNNLYLASSRPREYHYTPQYQASSSNQGGHQETNLREAVSEETIRTAVENIAATAVLAAILCQEVGASEQLNTAQVASPAREQPRGGLQAGNSDYHFDALRGLNSALDR